MAREHGRARLLMTTPAVGPIVALTYAGAIDDPARFKSSKQTGAHFGLTPKKYQSGETDITGRISKIGDAAVREALYQAAHVMLTKPVKGATELKSWAMRIARRAGMRKAKVALARKLAVDHASHARRQQTLQSGRQDRTGRGSSVARRITGFRAGHNTRPFRSEVPSPGRWIRSGRHPGCRHQPRICRLADLSSRTPSGDGPAPIPYRSKSPASG